MTQIEILRKQLHACEQNIRHAIVTIAASDANTTRTQGKMLVFENTAVGSIGGGAVERFVLHDAREAMRSGTGGLRRYDLNSKAADVGAVCGGALTVLIEVYDVRPTLVMCGAGHIGAAVMPLARTIGFEVILVDTRSPENILPGALNAADRFVMVTDYEAGLRESDIVPGAYYVIAGPNHDSDGAALAGALTKNAAYIGMIGSARKIDAISARLIEKGVTQQELDSVHAPIGLDIGGEQPEEIAVSIMAEILMVRNHKPRPVGL